MLRTPKPRQQAEILQEALKEAGVVLPNTWVLNVVARMSGARHWAALPAEQRAKDSPAYQRLAAVSAEGWAIELLTVVESGKTYGVGIAFANLHGVAQRAAALQAGDEKYVTKVASAPLWLIDHGCPSATAEAIVLAACGRYEDHTWERVRRLKDELEDQFSTWRNFEDDAETEPRATAVLDRRVSFEVWLENADCLEAKELRTLLALNPLAESSVANRHSEHCIPQSVLQLARRAAADNAFEHYDFGVPVGETEGWERIDPGVEWWRNVYLETSEDPEQPTTRVTFTVTFESPHSANVIGAST